MKWILGLRLLAIVVPTLSVDSVQTCNTEILRGVQVLQLAPFDILLGI